MYKKILPVVHDDGRHTIKELLEKHNYNYFKDYNDINKDIILVKNKEYKYNWKFNLSSGAVASFDIDSKAREEIECIIKQITDKIDIAFCSIDIIKTRDNMY